MTEEFLYSWRVKAVLCGVLLVAFIALDRWVASYATVLEEGNLNRVVCVGEVVDVNSGDIVYLQDGSALTGKITDWDMYGNVTLYTGAGESLMLKKGRRPNEILRTSEKQDQILTIEIKTWPGELRAKGVDFRGERVVVGNRFQGRIVDRVMRVGDKLFIDAPMKRADRIERIELREYFRNTFLLRLTAALCLSLIVVGGVKGLLTLVATISSMSIMLGVFVPGLLGAAQRAAVNGAWIVGVLAILGGVGWFAQRVLEEGGRGKLLDVLRARWLMIPGWVFAGVAGGGFMWATVRVIGQRPVPLALFISLTVTLITFTVITGFSAKVISGSLGTVGGLLACGLISVIASKLLWFTGLAVELGYVELGTVLWRTPGAREWPFVEFLSAGLIIAALGAMMDVSMSVSSTIYEVKRANPNISVVDAMKSGYNVGKDIMSTMTDTLIFAFIGADLVFIVMPGLIFQEAGRLYPFMRIFNSEETSVEAIHALMGTIGLVLAIPISAFIAGLLTARFNLKHAYASETNESGEEAAE